MTDIVKHNDELSIEVPGPGDMFLVKTVHAANEEATRRAIQGRERKLTPKRFKNLQQRLKAVTKVLDDADYFEKKQAYEDQVQRQTELLVERRLAITTARESWSGMAVEERQAAHSNIHYLRDQINACAVVARNLQAECVVLHPQARLRRAIESRIAEHQTAIAREKLHHQMRLELAKEAWDFGDIIIDTLAQQGYKHEVVKGKTRIVHKVKLEAPNLTPDRIYFKINTTRKTAFGFRAVLPQGVKVTDLISEETCHVLTIACQRQVQAKATLTNGAWLIVNRLNTRDGIMEYVTLAQVLSRYDRSDHRLLPVLLGVSEGREVWKFRISEHPHILIGGSTGGGKSNAENVFICTLIQMHSPKEVQFVLIDLKEGLEFRRYEQIPHLTTPVITEIEEAAKVLAQLEELRRQRAQEFAAYWTKDIDEYNQRMPEEKRMPRIMVIFDEYAAIKLKPDVEKTIQQLVMQLLNKGRAAGIHLIICTQNPSAEILPGGSKNNITFRLACLMPTKAASMTILGTGDAADLPPIPGRMIAMLGALRWQIQSPHVRPEDIQHALEIASEWERFNLELPEPSEIALGFTERRLIEVALSELDGNLKASSILKIVRQDELITQKQMYEMVKTLVAKKTIEFEGVTYTCQKQRGNFWRLIQVDS